VRFLRFLDFLIRVLEGPPPSLFIHKRAGIGLAGWKFAVFQLPKRLATNLIFGGPITLNPNSIKVYAKGVL
jgi:hypothetical protein